MEIHSPRVVLLLLVPRQEHNGRESVPICCEADRYVVCGGAAAVSHGH